MSHGSVRVIARSWVSIGLTDKVRARVVNPLNKLVEQSGKFTNVE